MRYLIEKELRDDALCQISEANGKIKTVYGKKVFLESLKTFVKKLEAEVEKMKGKNLA